MQGRYLFKGRNNSSPLMNKHNDVILVFLGCGVVRGGKKPRALARHNGICASQAFGNLAVMHSVELSMSVKILPALSRVHRIFRQVLQHPREIPRAAEQG